MKKVFEITFRTDNGELDRVILRGKGKTSVCHKFCGRRPRYAIGKGVIESIKEVK